MENDPRPTIDNIGPQGAKAAYLTLRGLGVKTSGWDRSLTDLNADWSDARVARTTLILAAPVYDPAGRKSLAAQVKRFLERGGRVLATGPSGAVLLPEGEVAPAGVIARGQCYTTPEGTDALARAGSVRMIDSSRWSRDGKAYRVEQRCGNDAVVVSYAVGRGEAVWWSSATPLENAALQRDADLRLLMATVGTGREVVFGESLPAAPTSLWDEAKGLPLGWLALQAALLFALLVLSFSRRRGPLRSPPGLPRSSPVEFAVSMGDLYEKAAASSVATEAARRRLLRVLAREAGLPRATVEEGIEEGPAAIAEALGQRLGGDWARVREHLREAVTAQQEAIAMRSALALVRALNEDARSVRESLKRAESLAPSRSGGQVGDTTGLSG